MFCKYLFLSRTCLSFFFFLELVFLIVYAQLCLHGLFVTPWTVARQTPLSMGFPRQGSWGGLPFPPPGDLCDPESEPKFPAWLPLWLRW